MCQSSYRSFLKRLKSSFALCSHILKSLWDFREKQALNIASMDSNIRNINENQESQDFCLSHWWILVWEDFFFLELIKSFIFLEKFLDQSSHENISRGQDIAISASHYLRRKMLCLWGLPPFTQRIMQESQPEFISWILGFLYSDT